MIRSLPQAQHGSGPDASSPTAQASTPSTGETLPPQGHNAKER